MLPEISFFITPEEASRILFCYFTGILPYLRIKGDSF